MKNTTINQAKQNKNDEFYTQLPDIERECNRYKDQFEGKVIYCNCDNPLTSNFFSYFVENFNEFKLKRFICSCYDSSSQLKEMWDDDEIVVTKAYKVVVNKVDKSIDKIREQIEENKSTQDIEVSFLQADFQYKAGDFRSDECVQIMNEADIIITNPPFSLFRDFVQTCEKYKKQYLIIGNTNAITYKEIFTLIKQGRLCTGYDFNAIYVYKTPYKNELENNAYQVKLLGYDPNEGYIKVPAIAWFTNLAVEKRNNRLLDKLHKTYNPIDYPTYINFTAINVDNVKDIPIDYFDLMGVPITFVDKYNPDEFEIIGATGTFELTKELGVTNIPQQFIDEYNGSGKRQIAKNVPILCYYDKDGKATVPYARIIIKRKV